MTMGRTVNAIASMLGDLRSIDIAPVDYRGQSKVSLSYGRCSTMHLRMAASFPLPDLLILYTQISDQTGRPAKQTDNQALHTEPRSRAV